VTDRTMLQRFTTRDAADDPSDLNGTDDLGCFGWLRGIRDRAVMLELRKKDGNILAVGYGWLERAEFDPSEGITLHGAGGKVRIKGRNLNVEVRQSIRLFEGITRHRVPWIQEASEPDSVEADPKSTVIDGIEW
jgi:hypothetical protein